MTAVQLNAEILRNLGTLAEDESMLKRVAKYLRKLVAEREADPYAISPSGDPFFADSRNVKAVEEDIRKAHSPQSKFTRLENKDDIMSMINAL